MADKKPSSWGDLADDGYTRDNFYIGGTDAKGHYERGRNIKIQPWIKDLIHRVIEEIPAYKGQMNNLFRNAITHQVFYDIERVNDPKTRETLMREFRLHVDMEDQARHLTRFAEMQRYVASTRVVLPIYAESGNWMMVSRELEKMGRNIEEGVLWEPCKSELEALHREYSAKLKAAS